MRETASFSLFARRLPATRAFIVAAGLEDVLEYVRSLRFTADGIGYLKSLGRFEPAFLDYLADLRFTGEIVAVPEGTIVFPDEPILEVTGPVIEAQLLETALLNIVHLQSVLASKAARVMLAARGRAVAEFGLRRSHGTDAGAQGRALRLDRRLRIHQRRPRGPDLRHPALRHDGAFVRHRVRGRAGSVPGLRPLLSRRATLLIDSYDTLEGARKAVVVAHELADAGHPLAGVRLDSGDLLALSREVRRILDSGGLHRRPDHRERRARRARHRERLLAAGAPIDVFGIGTRYNVSADAPTLDLVYKLVEYGGRDVLKLSEGKETWVGRKALYRMRDGEGRMAGDVLALAEEPAPPGWGPNRCCRWPCGTANWSERTRHWRKCARHCMTQIATLPEGLRRLEGHSTYAARVSDGLRERQEQAIRRVRGKRT